MGASKSATYYENGVIIFDFVIKRWHEYLLINLKEVDVAGAILKKIVLKKALIKMLYCCSNEIPIRTKYMQIVNDNHGYSI